MSKPRHFTESPLQCKRAEQWQRNLEIVRAHFGPIGVKAVWKNCDQEISFRDPRGPRVSFYPSTGRWYRPGAKGSISGGAKAFIEWYMKQFKKGGV